MASRSRRDVLTEAEDLLAGRSLPSARRLLEAIHAVNPTSRSLAPAETSRRYALKGRLQSLLIERHRDELTVHQDPEDPSVVSLRHRFMNLDACHAPVAALTDAARAWVQFCLDTDAHGDHATPAQGPSRRVSHPHPHPHPSPRTTAPAGDSLTLGRDAVDAYDFDAAREHLEAALAHPPTALPAAVALLELLVDHLAADGEALALEAGLGPEVAGSPVVRALLALAAARSGDHRRARGLLRGLAVGRAGDAWAHLAERAIAGGDLDEARRMITEVGQRAPAHPALPGLSRALGARVAEARRPAEDTAVDRLGHGDLDAAEAGARAVLARWGESDEARRVLREVHARRTESAAAELRARAETALSTGALAAAEAAVQRLAELVGGDADLAARVALARQRANEAAVTAATERVLAALRDDLPAGLRAWLGAGATVRARVRARTEAPEVAWAADALAHGASGGRAHGAAEGEALAAAVISLGAARGLLGAGDPDGALAALQPWGEALADVAAAREVLAQARRTIAARRLDALVAGLAAGEAAMARGDTAGARAALAKVPSDPPAEHRARAESLRHAVERAEDLARRVGRVDALEAREQWSEARDAVDELTAVHPDADPPRWRDRRAAIGASLRTQWRIQVWEGPEALADRGDGMVEMGAIALPLGPVWRVLDDGSAVSTSGHGRWLFIKVLGRDGSDVSRRIALRTPEPMEVVDWKFDGTVGWLVDLHGWILGFDVCTLDVVVWRHIPGLVPPPPAVPEAFIIGSRFIWVRREVQGQQVYTVVEHATGTAVRRVTFNGWLTPVRGMGAVAAVVLDAHPRGQSIRYFSARGETLDAASTHPDIPPAYIEAHPDGRSIVAMDSPALGTVGVASPLRAYTTVPGQPPGPRCIVLDNWDRERPSAVSSRASGAVFVLAGDHSQRRWLVALGFEDRAVVVRWRVPVTGVLALIPDARGEVAIGLGHGATGLRRIPLDGATPPREDLGTGLVRALPDLAKVLACHSAGCEPGALLELYVETLGRTPPHLAAWGMKAVAERTPEAAEALILGAIRSKSKIIGNLIPAGLARYPEHPAMVLLGASLAAVEGHWDDVLAAVGTRDPDGLPPVRAAHWLHLRGLAHLRKGDHHRAWEAWTAGAALDSGACGLTAALDLVATREDLAVRAATAPPSLVATVRAAVDTADACLAAGDGAGALRAIECPAVAVAFEQQSLARWAEAYLACPPATPGQWFAATAVISVLASARTPGADPTPLADFPLPGATWDAARLDALGARCIAWLDTNTTPF